jgi:hypothetical protein
MRTDQRVSASWCSQLSWFDHLLAPARNLPLRETPEGAMLATKPPGIWRMSAYECECDTTVTNRPNEDMGK